MKRILLIDDEKDLLELVSLELKDLLKGNEVKIDRAHDGLDAIIYITENKYDLIITDQKMPRMTGIEFINTMRNIQSSINKESPVVILTGYLDQATELLKSKENILMVSKPFDSKDFIEIVDLYLA
jgi:CheY-like chemotaxis protein